VIVNNTWGNVDPQAIKVLEAELMKNTLKAAIDMGAQVARNENTITSTQNIIRLVLDNHLSSLRTRSLIQDATVYHSIDNHSDGAYALSVGSECLRSGHRVGFPVGFPSFALVTYVCRSAWSDSVMGALGVDKSTVCCLPPVVTSFPGRLRCIAKEGSL